MYSVIILTKNEEQDIASCIRSIPSSLDIHVLDSESTDNTVEIAKEANARVWTNPFESFGKQRNWALDNIEVENEWILFLDADEHMTSEFQKAVESVIQSATPDIAGFYCCWKLMLEGVWLKHCDNFPKWQLRLCRKNRVRFTDFGHGQKEGEVDGVLSYVHEPYLHYAFSKGWTHWFDRHNRYSTLEAKDRHNQKIPFKTIFTSNKSMRNPALKVWLTKLPGWPALRFFHTYILNLGFLEGKAGFIYCLNLAYYEFLIKVKMREYRVFKDI